MTHLAPAHQPPLDAPVGRVAWGACSFPAGTFDGSVDGSVDGSLLLDQVSSIDKAMLASTDFTLTDTVRKQLNTLASYGATNHPSPRPLPPDRYCTD